MKREGSMHLVPAPAVRLMKSRVTSRPLFEISVCVHPCDGESFHKIAKDRKVIPDPIDDRKFQE